MITQGDNKLESENRERLARKGRTILLSLAAGVVFVLYGICGGLQDPYLRLLSYFQPPTIPADAFHADIGPELAQLDRMDHAAAEFARSIPLDIYEVNTPRYEYNSVHFAGTHIIVINRGRLPSVELRALALSHELFHAAHQFTVADLFVTEEYRAHRHVSDIAKAYHIQLPTNDAADLTFCILPSFLLPLGIIATACAAYSSPRSAKQS